MLPYQFLPVHAGSEVAKFRNAGSVLNVPIISIIPPPMKSVKHAVTP
jgi:hypothetical protein